MLQNLREMLFHAVLNKSFFFFFSRAVIRSGEKNSKNDFCRGDIVASFFHMEMRPNGSLFMNITQYIGVRCMVVIFFSSLLVVETTFNIR